MTLFALITTSVIIAVGNLSVTRIKTLNRVALLEELYFFSEQLFTDIKDWWTLDFEEYWNRQAFGVTTQSWHYELPTGVGNYGKGGILWSIPVYGSGIYLCRSNNGSNMWIGWCLDSYNNGADWNNVGISDSFSGVYQRYWEYLTQFTDYNGNADADLWDEDWDASGSIVWDDDDKSIGNVPVILSGAMQELYLINKTSKRRNFFRWNIKQDPNTAVPCSITTLSGKLITGAGCLGNVQILKLKWHDLWLSHSWVTSDKTAFDGVIDTWTCVETDQCTWPVLDSNTIIATWDDREWLDIFPSTINVKNVTFQIYPVKDPWISWAAPDCDQMNSTCVSPFIHPYVRMNLDMWFAWWKRRTLRNEDPTISISTSISLSDFE